MAVFGEIITLFLTLILVSFELGVSGEVARLRWGGGGGGGGGMIIHVL